MQDQLNRTLKIKAVPKRIVSLVPSQTELLCDLGLKENIVGVTKFCVHPNNIGLNATIVGGTKLVHIDRIKALQPDIILCNKEENTKNIVEACEKVCEVHVSNIFTLEDSFELIAQYGMLFNVEEKSANLIAELKTEFNSFKTFIQEKNSLKTLYFIWRLPWMVVGKHTFVDYLLQLNKFKNGMEEIRYPEISLKKDNTIELVLLSSEPYPFTETHKKELKKYYPKARILLVDGEMFSWYGSRLTKAFGYFKQLHEHL
ncbi:ABC transporter substrate-binding protein [Hyunsoonleella jejuensis]|nr:helical backbone metal receptor [Hyunsoonleella jejuensis]